MLQETKRQEISEQSYMTEKVIFAREMTEFVNPSKGIRKVIVNKNSDILDFPGIENYEIVRQLIQNGSTSPMVRYRTEFEKQSDGSHIMIWQIQPEGRYWEDDDGFGGEDDSEIRLYSYLDEDGKFTIPFRIYNVDNTKYFGTDREEQMAEARKRRKEMGSFEESMDQVLAAAAKTVLKHLNSGRSSCEVKFEIAESQNTGYLIVKLERSQIFYVMLHVVRDGLNTAYTDFLKTGTLEEVTRYLKSKSGQKGMKQAVRQLSNLVNRNCRS